jgi:hypothetical protein
MAAVITNADGGILHEMGALRALFVSINLDASYPTGGYPITLIQIGLSQILYADFQARAGYVFEWDYTNLKLKAFTSNGASPAALLEVPNTTSLATVTAVRGVFYGR